MNVHDMLADRQAALMQSRKQISIGRNPNDVAPGQQQLPTPLINTNKAVGQPPVASRVAPPPPYQADNNVVLGTEVPANDLPLNENAAIGVPVAANRALPYKGPLGPNGKPLVQPQPGSKEDLRRRRAIKEERERVEAVRRAQAESQIAQATSPVSWYTASSNTVASPTQQSQAQRAASSSLSPPSGSGSGSGSSNSQRSALSFAVKRKPVHLVVPARSGSASGSCDSAGSGSSGERRRTSYSTLVTVPQGRQPGLIVEEDEEDLKTPTPPEVKLEREKALAEMFAASGIGAAPVSRSADDSDDSETGEIKAAVIVRRSSGPGAMEEQQQNTEKSGEPRLRTSTETVGSRESMTMTGTDEDGSLKTPTTAEFRNRNQGGVVGSQEKPNENDSNVSIPTIISSSADDENPRKDSNASDFQAFIKGFPGNLGQKARIVSDMGRRLSGMMGKAESSAPSTPSGSRRPSVSSSVAPSEMDADGMPRNAMGKAVHRDFWKPDHLSTHCDYISCNTEFSLRVRKHHCRYCGCIFCDVHSAFALNLYYPPVEQDDEDSRSNQTSAIDLAALASRFTGGVARSRVCATCFEKVAHPEKLLARRAAAKGIKTRPLVLHDKMELPSTDEEDSDDSDDEGDDGKETFEEYRARKQQRKVSSAMNRAPPRRMFSAPATPLSRSPPKPSADNYVINSANVSPRTSLRQSKNRVRTTTGSRAPSRSGTALSRQASLSSAARKVFSPTVEAMKPSSASPAEGSNRNSYFPAMPAPGVAHLPGEEPNATVTGILATYPLAHKPVTSPSSPYTPGNYSQSSLLSLGSLAGPGRTPNESSSRDSSRSRSRHNLTIQNMPALGMGNLDHMQHKLQSIGHNGTSTNTTSSAGPLTPDREWVPSAWGYDRETFDPDRELDDDEEEMKRGRTKLVVDGAFRFKAKPVAEEQDDQINEFGRDEQQRHSTSLTWATF